MRHTVEVQEGMEMDHKHIRVLARVPALDELVILSKTNNFLVSTTTVKRSGRPFERRKIYDIARDVEIECLCCLFDISHIHHIRKTATTVQAWISIEK